MALARRSLPFLRCLVLALALGLARLASGQDAVGNWRACGGISVGFCAEDRACAECENDGWVCKSGGEGDPDPYYWQCVPDPRDASSEQEEEGEEAAVAEGASPLAGSPEESDADAAPAEAEPGAPEAGSAPLPDPASIAASIAPEEEEEEAAGEPPASGEEQEAEVDETEDLRSAGDWAACGGLSVDFCGEDRACRDCASDGWVCRSGGEGPANAYYWQCVPAPGGSGSSESALEQDGEAAPAIADPAAAILDPAAAILDPAAFESAANATDEAAIVEPAENATAAAPAILVAEYGQCGGRDLCDGRDESCGTCTEGFYCQRDNEWYHQCVSGSGSADSTDSAGGQEDLAAETAAANTTSGSGNFTIPADSEGLAQTTRFFDGCKASCAWTGNVGPTVTGPVQSCRSAAVFPTLWAGEGILSFTLSLLHSLSPSLYFRRETSLIRERQRKAVK